MPFPKDPRVMSDDELCDWAKKLIKRRAPESNRLDYKENISTESKEDRIELAKDVSSFANENGGVLLYGVPETKENGIPVPEDLSKCGISIVQTLPETIENILLDAAEPLLPELQIRVLFLKELNGKSLLMLYHPESWNKPHMIEGYKEGRYYRRGNFRAVIMNEKEIESAYLSRKISRSHADEFFKTGDFRPVPKVGSFLRFIICPRFPLVRREMMSEEKFKTYLESNPPNRRPGDWIPFLDGWTFRGYPNGNFHGKQYEFRLFHNGGFCFNIDLAYFLRDQSELMINQIEKCLKEWVLPYANAAFEVLGINGPLSMQFNLFSIKGLNAKIPIDSWNADIGLTPLENDSLRFVEETSTSELRFKMDNVLMRIIDRLASAFGIWRK